MLFFVHSLCLLLAAALSISAINPCFEDRSSEQCITFIAEKRHITTSEAKILIRRALALYVNEESSQFSLYDRDTVAVACLASDGILRPGLDDDCEACEGACTPEVYNLYCTSSQPLPQTTQRLTMRWTYTTMKKDRDQLTIVSHTNFSCHTACPVMQEKLKTPIIIIIMIVSGGLAVLFGLIIGAILICIKNISNICSFLMTSTKVKLFSLNCSYANYRINLCGLVVVTYKIEF